MNALFVICILCIDSIINCDTIHCTNSKYMYTPLIKKYVYDYYVYLRVGPLLAADKISIQLGQQTFKHTKIYEFKT